MKATSSAAAPISAAKRSRAVSISEKKRSGGNSQGLRLVRTPSWPAASTRSCRIDICAAFIHTTSRGTPNAARCGGRRSAGDPGSNSPVIVSPFLARPPPCFGLDAEASISAEPFTQEPRPCATPR